MLRRALVIPPRQRKGVSCPAHNRLGCVQPRACPLPQRFSVRTREQVRLVQLRDGLRAFPSLDVAAGRGVAVLFPEQRVGITTAWLRQMSQRLAHHYASFTGEAAVHDFEARRGWPEHPRRQPKPSCSKRGCCGGTSSERTNVRVVPLVATTFLKLTCWKAPEAPLAPLFAVVPSSHVAPSRASRARQQLNFSF